MTLSVVLSHARHFTECEQYITHSATSMSLSLSPFLSRFSIGKTKRTPKDEWRLESSFLHVPLCPSIHHTKVFSPPLSFSLSLLFCQITHRRSFIPSKRSSRPDARYVLRLRAENSLSQIKHERNTTLLLPKRRHRSPGHVNT